MSNQQLITDEEIRSIEGRANHYGGTEESDAIEDEHYRNELRLIAKIRYYEDQLEQTRRIYNIDMIKNRESLKKAQAEIELLRGLLENEAHSLVLACEAYRITQLVKSSNHPLIQGDWNWILDKAEQLDNALHSNGIVKDDE